MDYLNVAELQAKLIELEARVQELEESAGAVQELNKSPIGLPDLPKRKPIKKVHHKSMGGDE